MVFDSTTQKHNRRRCHEKWKMSILEQTAKYGVIDRDGEKVSFKREGFTREINAYINVSMTKDCETQSQKIYLASLVF